MGYTTEFKGKFLLNKALDQETYNFLKKLSETRRMKRNVSLLPEGYEKYNLENWGEEGEFFVDAGGLCGQDRESSIVDYNTPPITQPGLWCHWTPTEDKLAIKWDDGEKFYDYIEWIEYLIDKILKPRKYKLNGTVQWRGEEFDDIGEIQIKNNKVKIK